MQRKKTGQRSPVPDDQRVFSKIGYAAQSQGIANIMTVERQPNSENESRLEVTGSARIAAIRGRLGNAQQNARCADLPTQVARKMGDREHDSNVYYEDRIPRNQTYGHELWIAGDSQSPWIWCVRCGAYTNKSVRNLNKNCKGHGCMHVVRQLNEGYEPVKPKCKTDVMTKEPDETLLIAHFNKPASTDSECRNLIWAIHAKIKREAKVTRRKIWPDIVMNYNCRVVRARRITQPNAKRAVALIQEAKKHDRSLEVDDDTQMAKKMLATAPRPCTWTDLGRIKNAAANEKQDSAAKIESLCMSLRAMALKRMRSALNTIICARKHTSGSSAMAPVTGREIIVQGLNNEYDGMKGVLEGYDQTDYTWFTKLANGEVECLLAKHFRVIETETKQTTEPWQYTVGTNALTGATRVSRRRAFNIPKYTAAIPAHDWPKPEPLDLTKNIILVGSSASLAFFDYHSELNVWMRAQMQEHARAVPTANEASEQNVTSNDSLELQHEPPFEDTDPFGFGGGLD